MTRELSTAVLGILAIFGILYLINIVSVCNFKCDTGEDPGIPAYYR